MQILGAMFFLGIDNIKRLCFHSRISVNKFRPVRPAGKGFVSFWAIIQAEHYS